MPCNIVCIWEDLDPSEHLNETWMIFDDQIAVICEYELITLSILAYATFSVK